MALFELSFPIIKRLEGGYVNDPEDRGGETFAGISRKYWGDWPGWIRIDYLKERPTFKELINLDGILWDLAKEFYREQYWSPLRLSEVINQVIADELLEASILCGHENGVKFAQRALNLLNKNGKLYKDTPEDGAIGPETISLLNKFKEGALLRTMNGLQFEYFVELCRRDPGQEKFFYSWLNRT